MIGELLLLLWLTLLIFTVCALPVLAFLDMKTWMFIAGGIILGHIMILLILTVLNRWLGKWACTALGWHLAPESKGFDGCSLQGKCPRCGKPVLMDSQGNWF